MNITQFEKEKLFAPFLGSTLNSINGLDQLGLNLTSERIFDFLLPGLNNVTARIRYYSFYSWFFSWYSREIRVISASEQFKYLRRAEFLLSLIGAHNHQAGIPGILRANEIYSASGEEFNLDDGTGESSGTTEGSYWKNTRGVLGQYYVSSLHQIGIIKDQGDAPGVYVATDFKNEEKVSGKELAVAFEDSVGQEAIGLFTGIVKKKTFSKDELDKLSSAYNMLSVPEASEENKLLLQLLLNADRPGEAEKTFFRKHSIHYLLMLLNEPQNQLTNQFHLPWYAYKRKVLGNSEKETTLSLWWLFMLEQFWSVAATGILKSVLEILDAAYNGSWAVLEEFVDQLTDEISLSIQEIEPDSFKGSFEDINSIGYNEFDLYAEIQGKDSPTRLVAGLYLIHKILEDSRQYRDELFQLSKKHNLHTQSSFLVASFELQKMASLPISEFVRKFLKKYVLYRHHFVSLRKMTASQSSAKFIIEDGLIRYIDKFNFDLASPRIHTVTSFLEDLGYKEREQFSLTVKGDNLLKSLS